MKPIIFSIRFANMFLFSVKLNNILYVSKARSSLIRLPNKSVTFSPFLIDKTKLSIAREILRNINSLNIVTL